MSKNEKINWLKAFISLWNKAETAQERLILSDLYEVFCDGERLPFVSADENLFALKGKK